MHDSAGLTHNDKVRKKCVELYEAGYRTNHLLACIIDICQNSCINDESPESIFHINNALKVIFIKYKYTSFYYETYISLIYELYFYICIFYSCAKSYPKITIRSENDTGIILAINYYRS